MGHPISLILDDGGPVNGAYFGHPMVRTKLVVPNRFTTEFADICDRYGVRGKFSVVPMQSELGRMDREFNYLPAGHLAGFLEIARERIAPRFDITPEMLTHTAAIDVKTGGTHHVAEDVWFSTATVDQMTDYIALALRILKRIGLSANGVTSPWAAGIEQEKNYARAIARAQWRVHRRKLTWYFLHCLCPGNARWPWVTHRDRKTGQTVVSVPATTDDVFWATQHKDSARAARAAADAGVDSLLSRDGKTGAVRELLDAKMPIVLLTHWQSLFSDGRATGLGGMEKLLERIERTIGSDVEWVTCSKLARGAVRD